jgi:hypothetical protein
MVSSSLTLLSKVGLSTSLSKSTLFDYIKTKLSNEDFKNYNRFNILSIPFTFDYIWHKDGRHVTFSTTAAFDYIKPKIKVLSLCIWNVDKKMVVMLPFLPLCEFQQFLTIL